MVPKEYIDALRDVQRTLAFVKEDLDRAVRNMEYRLESGDEDFDTLSRLAVLAGREYIKLADDALLKLSMCKIQY